MSKLSTGLLIVAVAVAGIYAIAATIATTTSASFTYAETTSHKRLVEFATEVKWVADENRTAHAKCELLAGAERNLCNAEADAKRKRATTPAPAEQRNGINPPIHAGLKVPGPAYQVDVALHQAHR